MLICPVRDCKKTLMRAEKTAFCSQKHTFDISRSGYINLLQPQDRKSKTPGDTNAAIEGRRALHDRGITEPLFRAISDMVQARPEDIALDVGCGDGFYLGSLQQRTDVSSYGVDISVASIDKAARRYPECEWVVANADRFIPYADQSFSLILSITARMNSPEFRRVLKPDGRLLVAVPSPEDLIEIRGQGRSRTQRTIEMFSEEFSLVGKNQVTTVADLDAGTVEGVAASIYRPQTAGKLRAMKVTLGLDLMLFKVRR